MRSRAAEPANIGCAAWAELARYLKPPGRDFVRRHRSGVQRCGPGSGAFGQVTGVERPLVSHCLRWGRGNRSDAFRGSAPAAAHISAMLCRSRRVRVPGRRWPSRASADASSIVERWLARSVMATFDWVPARCLSCRWARSRWVWSPCPARRRARSGGRHTSFS
jgi:hypothetical protein